MTQLPAHRVCALLLAVSWAAQVMFGQRPPPNYSPDALPDTAFSCDTRAVGGYYADVEAGCQMFHVCGASQHTSFRFLCPNDTVFDQQNLICANWYQVTCEPASLRNSRNFEIFKTNSVEESLFNTLDEGDQLRPGSHPDDGGFGTIGGPGRFFAIGLTGQSVIPAATTTFRADFGGSVRQSTTTTTSRPAIPSTRSLRGRGGGSRGFRVAATSWSLRQRNRGSVASTERPFVAPVRADANSRDGRTFAVSSATERARSRLPPRKNDVTRGSSKWPAASVPPLAAGRPFGGATDHRSPTAFTSVRTSSQQAGPSAWLAAPLSLTATEVPITASAAVIGRPAHRLPDTSTATAFGSWPPPLSNTGPSPTNLPSADAAFGTFSFGTKWSGGQGTAATQFGSDADRSETPLRASGPWSLFTPARPAMSHKFQPAAPTAQWTGPFAFSAPFQPAAPTAQWTGPFVFSAPFQPQSVLNRSPESASRTVSPFSFRAFGPNVLLEATARPTATEHGQASPARPAWVPPTSAVPVTTYRPRVTPVTAHRPRVTPVTATEHGQASPARPTWVPPTSVVPITTYRPRVRPVTAVRPTAAERGQASPARPTWVPPTSAVPVTTYRPHVTPVTAAERGQALPARPTWVPPTSAVPVTTYRPRVTPVTAVPARRPVGRRGSGRQGSRWRGGSTRRGHSGGPATIHANTVEATEQAGQIRTTSATSEQPRISARPRGRGSRRFNPDLPGGNLRQLQLWREQVAFERATPQRATPSATPSPDNGVTPRRRLPHHNAKLLSKRQHTAKYIEGSSDLPRLSSHGKLGARRTTKVPGGGESSIGHWKQERKAKPSTNQRGSISFIRQITASSAKLRLKSGSFHGTKSLRGTKSLFTSSAALSRRPTPSQTDSNRSANLIQVTFSPKRSRTTTQSPTRSTINSIPTASSSKRSRTTSNSALRNTSFTDSADTSSGSLPASNGTGAATSATSASTSALVIRKRIRIFGRPTRRRPPAPVRAAPIDRALPTNKEASGGGHRGGRLYVWPSRLAAKLTLSSAPRATRRARRLKQAGAQAVTRTDRSGSTQPTPSADRPRLTASEQVAQTTRRLVSERVKVTAQPAGQRVKATAQPAGQRVKVTAQPAGQRVKATAQPAGQRVKATAQPAGQRLKVTAQPAGQRVKATAQPAGQRIKATAQPAGQRVKVTAQPAGQRVKATAQPAGQRVKATSELTKTIQTGGGNNGDYDYAYYEDDGDLVDQELVKKSVILLHDLRKNPKTA